MEGPPLGPGGEDITWPDQVAPRGRKASSTRKIKPQTSNPSVSQVAAYHDCSQPANVCLVDHVLHGYCPNVMTLVRQRRTVASYTRGE